MNISVNDSIILIQQEIIQHIENPSPVLSEEFQDGFITGLKQAVFILQQAKIALEQENGKSEV